MVEEKLSGGVQSLEVGLAVLNALVEHNQPIILKDLSHKLSMHPAKVHRYLKVIFSIIYLVLCDYTRTHWSVTSCLRFTKN